MKKTPLNRVHKNMEAKMTNFGGWEMPIEYDGIIKEHNAVRKKAGLFDVSHMGEILVSGKNSFASLQRIITNDLNKLKAGKALYTPICNQEGGIIDDLLVYCLQKDKFLLVVNASNTEKDYSWLRENVLSETTVENISDYYALLALQGPNSKKILAKLTTLNLNNYSLIETKIAGVEMIISKTGYTGELGYELYFKAEKAEKIWELLFEAGADFSLQACGLGARDTLRLEKRYVLYGNDIDENRNPYEAGLGWTVALNKGDFIGSKKLINIKANCCQQKLSAFKILGRGVARPEQELYFGKEKVGKVTSGSYSPTLKKGIGLAYLKSKYTAAGTALRLEIRDREVKAEVIKGTFV